MKEILLTLGKKALVDDEDYDELSKFNWCAHKDKHGFFTAIRHNGNRQVKMHREILTAPTNKQVDHINGNTLDNRRANLRLASQSQNQANRPKWPGTTSKYKGVYWNRGTNKWHSSITFNKRVIYLGQYDVEEDAAKAYDAKAKELFGEFAKTNSYQHVLI